MPDVRLRIWSDEDLGLLVRANAPEMKEHLGGPEPDDKVVDRHRRYLALTGGRMYAVLADGEPVGGIGFWEKAWRDEPVYETGWNVLPEHQGRGIAVAAARLVVEEARAYGGRDSLHAFPHVDNAASNAVCERAGFTLVGAFDFEYPPGTHLRCNDWRIALG